jgi:hypothetical protein
LCRGNEGVWDISFAVAGLTLRLDLDAEGYTAFDIFGCQAASHILFDDDL